MPLFTASTPRLAGRHGALLLALLLLGGPAAHAQAALDAPSALAMLGDLLYLGAPTPTSGGELFAVDLATGEARLVAELVEGEGGSDPDHLTVFDGRLFFRAATPATGAEVFAYDPTTGEAALAADLVPGPEGSSPTALEVWDGVLVVTGRTPDGTPEVWTVSADVALATADARPLAALGGVAPNPTRGRAVVTWTLAEAGEARVTVSDLLGREVGVVARGPFAAGAHEAALPAGLSPGVYVVRLTAGTVAEVARFTVVR